MSLFQDVRTLARLAWPGTNAPNHRDRLEQFYGPQAKSYDSFRRHLLPARKETIDSIPDSALKEGVWLDIGCGTGVNLDFAVGRIGSALEITMIDLAEPLLRLAIERSQRLGLSRQVKCKIADATNLQILELSPTLITISYALTMIPQWWRTLLDAARVLAPGGLIAICDFCVSPSYEPVGSRTQNCLQRNFWRTWFEVSGVRLSPDHVPMVSRLFERQSLYEGSHPLPYLPFLKAPYYSFLGRKART